MTLRVYQHINLGNSIKNARSWINSNIKFLPCDTEARGKAIQTLHMLDDLSISLESLLAKEVPQDKDPRYLMPTVYQGSASYYFTHPEKYSVAKDMFYGWEKEAEF